jgi:hypothetical protein
MINHTKTLLEKVSVLKIMFEKEEEVKGVMSKINDAANLME